MTKNEIEDSLEYQDFISVQLLQKLGWSINLYTSRKYQIEKGESISGIEIKNDKKMASTGNLYIELEERHSKDKPFVKSGILRDDNTILWIIGDYNTAYIFVKAQLKHLCEGSEKNGFKKVETETSKGVLIPLSYFDKHPLFIVKKLNFKENANDMCNNTNENTEP